MARQRAAPKARRAQKGWPVPHPSRREATPQSIAGLTDCGLGGRFLDPGDNRRTPRTLQLRRRRRRPGRLLDEHHSCADTPRQPASVRSRCPPPMPFANSKPIHIPSPPVPAGNQRTDDLTPRSATRRAAVESAIRRSTSPRRSAVVACLLRVWAQSARTDWTSSSRHRRIEIPVPVKSAIPRQPHARRLAHSAPARRPGPGQVARPPRPA